jgi:hypothetical protein
MSITRSAVRNVTRSTIRDVVRGGYAPAGRYYTNFIASRSSYAEFDTEISVSTAYKIKIDVQFKSGISRELYVLGKIAGRSHEITIKDSGQIEIKPQFERVTTTETITRDDIIHELEIELDGNDFIFRIDGVLFDTVTNITASQQLFTFSAIATRNLDDFFDGYLANLHVEENSVVVASLAMDEPFEVADFANSVDPSNPATKVNVLADQVVFI